MKKIQPVNFINDNQRVTTTISNIKIMNSRTKRLIIYMQENKKTFFDHLFIPITEIEGLPVKFGYVGNKSDPMGYVIMNEGKISFGLDYKNMKAKFESILMDILKQYEQQDNETPW